VPHTRHDMLAAGAAHHLTYRQLDHWTRLGHLHTIGGQRPGSGHDRRWADGEAGIFATIGRLLAAGLTLDAAIQAARGQTHLAPGVTVLILPAVPMGPCPPDSGWCTWRDGHAVSNTDIETAAIEQTAAAS
jgi:hypothetical protein